MPNSNRPAFTLVELLVSLFILFSTTTAFLSLYNWLQNDIDRYQEKNSIIHLATPSLYHSQKNQECRSLDECTIFKQLKDDEIFWLRSQHPHLYRGAMEKKILFESDQSTLSFYLLHQRLQGDHSWVHFIRTVP